jgi:hypothetical protein
MGIARSRRIPAKMKLRGRKKSARRVSDTPQRGPDGQSPAGSRQAVRIAARLRAFLGLERDAVIKAQSLVVCVTTAMQMEHGATGPYYPDVLGLAADILRRRVVNFDELLLDGVVPDGTTSIPGAIHEGALI